jgi:hypothetical protein
VEEAEQLVQRSAACRIWGCRPEDAARLDTPLRWQAWDVWVRSESGTAQDFFRECSRVRDIFRDALERRIACDQEIVVTGKCADQEYMAKRLAIIAGDAMVQLMSFNPSMVACVAADVIADRKLMNVVHAYVAWAESCRRWCGPNGNPARLDMLGTYQSYVKWVLQTWSTRQRATAA